MTYVIDMHTGSRQRRRRVARTRWLDGDGTWVVSARVERFAEPVLLLALRNGSAHGYELADELGRQFPDGHVDLGNLYRLLRSMEAEGLVESEWHHEAEGRSKRTYELTAEGSALLNAWAHSLRATDETISAFLRTYDEGSRP